MDTHTKSPEITTYSWGSIEVEGKKFRDVKCFPGGAREWDWNEMGTDHDAGIQPGDVEELLNHGAKVIVLSKGVYERLHVSEAVINLLNQKNIKTYIHQTDEAIKLYNTLRETEPVGGLFHTTC